MTGMGERGSWLGVGAAALTAILPTLRDRRNSWVGCGRYPALRRHPYPFFSFCNGWGTLADPWVVPSIYWDTEHETQASITLFTACRVVFSLSCSPAPWFGIVSRRCYYGTETGCSNGPYARRSGQ